MFGKYLKNLKENGALIHNITNYVTVNDVANILLASGGSPIMTDYLPDALEIIEISNGLNLNIGTLNKRTVETMLETGKKANLLDKIIVLDAVGVGATKTRTNIAIELINNIKFDVIKGNISEIKTLAKNTSNTSGVDANINDELEKLEDKIKFIKLYAQKIKTIIVVTGKIDIITNGKEVYLVENGNSLMSSVTGTGCQLSALITAFMSANKEEKMLSTVGAVITMGVAGEIGYENMLDIDGNSTYRNRIIDAIFNMNEEIIDKREKVERYE